MFIFYVVHNLHYYHVGSEIIFRILYSNSKGSNLLYYFYRAYVPGGRVNFNNVKHAIRMVSDYAYNGQVGLTADLLLKTHPNLPTYFYQYSYSASHSFCDQKVYYGWKFSLKLQLHQLGLGMSLNT